MDDIKQKACYRPNFKPSKDPSNGTKKQEIWHTHTSREPWTSSPKGNEACSLLINGVICEKPPWSMKKSSMSSKQKGS